MRKTLKNINTMVRDILHDAGFPMVRKQVESRELHVLTAKITDDTLKNLNGCTEILDLRTTVGNADDNEDKILPFVTIGYTIINIHEGKFHHESRSRYQWKQFAFENKAKLEKDFQKFFEDHRLMTFLASQKQKKNEQKEPVSPGLKVREICYEANKVLSKPFSELTLTDIDVLRSTSAKLVLFGSNVTDEEVKEYILQEMCSIDYTVDLYFTRHFCESK